MQQTPIKRILSVLCIAALLVCFTACKKAEIPSNETADATSDTATPDSATPDTATPDTVTLTSNAKRTTAAALSADTDWESLYYEYLRSLDSERFPQCALVYLNDDEVPELYLGTDGQHNDPLLNVTDDGFFVTKCDFSFREASEFIYLEKQDKILIKQKVETISDDAVDKSTEESSAETTQKAQLYNYPPTKGDTEYHLKEYQFANDAPYTKISVSPGKTVHNVNEDLSSALKDYLDFDVEKAKSPDLIPINDMIDRLKGERKYPDLKVTGSDGDVASLVSTYKDLSGTATKNEETDIPVRYRIPQIELEGEEIAAINQEILDTFDEVIAQAEKADGKTISSPLYQEVDYTVSGRSGILSLAITATGFGGKNSHKKYLIYNIDIAAKKKIGNLCLLNSYGVDPQQVTTAFAEQVKSQFTAEAYDNTLSDDLLDSLYHDTVAAFSPVEEHSRMCFDDNGNLTVVYRHAQLAGASYVEKALTLYL